MRLCHHCFSLKQLWWNRDILDQLYAILLWMGLFITAKFRCLCLHQQKPTPVFTRFTSYCVAPYLCPQPWSLSRSRCYGWWGRLFSKSYVWCWICVMWSIGTVRRTTNSRVFTGLSYIHTHLNDVNKRGFRIVCTCNLIKIISLHWIHHWLESWKEGRRQWKHIASVDSSIWFSK